MEIINFINMSSIQKISEKKLDASLKLKVSDLTVFGQFLIDNTIKVLSEKPTEPKEVFLKSSEVLKVLLLKDRTSLWRWRKSGFLVPIKVGKSIRYKQSEVLAILNGEVPMYKTDVNKGGE